MTADQAKFTVLDEIEAADTLQGLLDQVAVEVPERQTGTERKAEIARAIERGDSDELIGLQEKLEGIIERILANKAITEHTGLCTPAELADLMIERLDQADVAKLVEIRYQMIRTRVFDHITEDNRAKGIDDPGHTPGQADVPALKKRFTREGGRIKNVLDQSHLRELLGEKRWAQVCRAETIPEHVEYHLSEDALLELVRKDPKVLDLFKKCIIPGGEGIPRFHIRPLG